MNARLEAFSAFADFCKRNEASPKVVHSIMVLVKERHDRFHEIGDTLPTTRIDELVASQGMEITWNGLDHTLRTKAGSEKLPDFS
jgi:hypothetical protein